MTWVSVSIQPSTRLVNGFEVTVAYDPQVLAPVLHNGQLQVVPLSPLPGEIAVQGNMVSPGKIRFLWYEYNQQHVSAGWIPEDGRLFAFPMKMLAANERQSASLNISAAQISYENQQAQEYEIQNLEPGQGAELQLLPTPLAKGDIDLDGQVTVRDLVLAKRHIVGVQLLQDGRLLAADANRDGLLNALDMMKIKNMILGMEVPA